MPQETLERGQTYVLPEARDGVGVPEDMRRDALREAGARGDAPDVDLDRDVNVAVNAALSTTATSPSPTTFTPF